MIGYLTYDEAIVELSKLMENPNNVTKDTLSSLVEKISVQDPNARVGATTYLYSGMINESLHSSVYVKDIAEAKGSDVRIIDNTSASTFLSSDGYKDALKTALKNENPELSLIENETILKKAIGDYMYSAEDGPWANRSAEFAGTATGNIEYIVPNADPGRVWWRTEVKKALADPNIPSINGVPREELLAARTFLEGMGYSREKAADGVCELIKVQSNVDLLKAGVEVRPTAPINLITELGKEYPVLTEVNTTIANYAEYREPALKACAVLGKALITPWVCGCQHY